MIVSFKPIIGLLISSLMLIVNYPWVRCIVYIIGQISKFMYGLY
jgi:hypothetical protein